MEKGQTPGAAAADLAGPDKARRERPDAARSSKELEKTYRERREGFVRWARRESGGSGDAEEIVQEAFARALARLNAMDVIEDLAAWVFASIRNRVIDRFRAAKRRESAGEREVAEAEIAEIVADAGFDPADAYARRELSDALGEAMAALPSDQRYAIEGRILEGLSYRELSERSGVPIPTLSARAALAKAKLAKSLRDWVEED